MAKQILLFAGQGIDPTKQTVSVNQVIQMYGYSDPTYVVYKVEHETWGVDYKLIDVDNYTFNRTRSIRPLSQKFGIGFYYDEKNPQFKTAEEVAELLVKAQIKLKSENEETERKSNERKAVEVVGKEWLEKNLPNDAQALIIACLKQDQSDSQTDYFASKTVRTVILGFSKHKRDIFSEMRKLAGNFEETSYLTEYNEEYEHREKYSMGHGYYLGKSYYSGWIIKKAPIYSREGAIKEFASVAGCPDGIYLKERKNAPPFKRTCIGEHYIQFEIVDYSEKAIALFGDTKPIKDLLKAMGGKFNPRLVYKADKRAGWIFQKSKRDELTTVLNLKAE